VIRRPAGGSWVYALEAERLKIQFIDKDADNAHRVVFAARIRETA